MTSFDDFAVNPHVLFLDVDGVINNRWSMTEGVERAKAEGTGYTDFEGFMFPSRMDPKCIERLNRLVKVGGFDVVLSSIWRYGRPWEVTSRYFRQVCGAAFDLIGATPRAWKSHGRGEEIERWRQEQGDARSFVILDDDSDMEPHMDRLVLVKGEPGLQDHDVDSALRLILPR